MRLSRAKRLIYQYAYSTSMRYIKIMSSYSKAWIYTKPPSKVAQIENSFALSLPGGERL